MSFSNISLNNMSFKSRLVSQFNNKLISNNGSKFNSTDNPSTSFDIILIPKLGSKNSTNSQVSKGTQKKSELKQTSTDLQNIIR